MTRFDDSKVDFDHNNFILRKERRTQPGTTSLEDFLRFLLKLFHFSRNGVTVLAIFSAL
jgi:hypothetical protein